MMLKIKRTIYIYILLMVLCSLHGYSQKRNFGNAGLKGLSSAQMAKLVEGEIVFLNANTANADGNSSMIEAVLLFSSSTQTAWELISKTDDQPKYINRCKEIRVITKSRVKACEVHCVGSWLRTYYYGVIENYIPEAKCIFWTLDPGYSKNDLSSLNGYWQLYSYPNGKTLARYGSSVSFKNVPEFIEDMFKKGGVRDALASVKKYVDSGGSYRK